MGFIGVDGEASALQDRLAVLYFDKRVINGGRWSLFNLRQGYHYDKLLDLVANPNKEKATKVSSIGYSLRNYKARVEATRRFVEFMELGTHEARNVEEEGETVCRLVNIETGEIFDSRIFIPKLVD